MLRGLREERGGGMGGFGIDRYIIVFSRFSIYIRVCGENNDPHRVKDTFPPFVYKFILTI